ncbi:hypothetical protein HDU87_004909 [Geranomyces variabilis]|uniref:Uncharacterized protein n=1 Tax=Geranomyces variabilis TaxID=109894 RepID=A0AAD5TJR4_9FUNG|nr:hypothetical protein HDU87_004909 [Geranomyces variabilis]
MLATSTNAGKPDATSAAAHPKIQTESKYDIFYLKAVLRQHALAALSAHAPTNPNTTSLKPQIDSWLERTFALAGDSILINGVPYAKALEKAAPEYEPLDETLAGELDSACNRIVDATVRVARWRKEVPVAVGRSVKENLEKWKVEDDDDAGEPVDTEVASKITASQEVLPANHSPAQLIPVLSQTLEIPLALQSSLPSLSAKLGRADAVIRDLEFQNVPSSAHSTPKRRRTKFSPPPRTPRATPRAR